MSAAGDANSGSADPKSEVPDLKPKPVAKKEEIPTDDNTVIGLKESDAIRDYILKMYAITLDSPLYKKAFDN